MSGVFPKTGESIWLAEYDVDVYNAPEVFSVPPLTRLIPPVMSGHVRPDITGEFPNNDAEYDKYYAGAFWTGTPFEGGYSDQLPAGGKTGRFKASWANSIYGCSSDVLVDALYVLIIIKT